MNVAKLNQAIERLKENLGEGLIATDIWTKDDAVVLTGYNSQPVASALFNRITDSINSTLSESGFPTLGRYLMLDLIDGKMVMVIPLGDYRWGMLVDRRKAQLGILLNVALPKAIGAFEEAITG